MKKYLLLISILFFSCQKEEALDSELPTVQSIPTLENVRENFSSNNISEASFFDESQGVLKSSVSAKQHIKGAQKLDRRSENFDIDWQASHEKSFKEGVNFLYTPIHKIMNGRTKTILASVLHNGDIETYAYTMVYDEKSTNKQFSGYIFKHDIKGVFVSAYHYESGQKTKIFMMNTPKRSYASMGFSVGLANNISCTTSIFEIVWAITSGISPENMLDCVVVRASGGGNNGSSSSSRRNNRNNWSDPGDNLQDGNNGGSGGGSFGSIGSKGSDSGDANQGEILNTDGIVPWWNEDDNSLENFLNQDVWDEQNPYDRWNELSECEKDFFRANPQHLYNAKSNRSEAEDAAHNRFGNCDNGSDHPLHNTIGDAYRHAYFAALNTHIMGYSKAKTLGDAHECEVPISELNEKEMDLHNNAWGYHYGSAVSVVNEEQLYDSFMDAVNRGQIKIIQECQ